MLTKRETTQQVYAFEESGSGLGLIYVTFILTASGSGRVIIARHNEAWTRYWSTWPSKYDTIADYVKLADPHHLGCEIDGYPQPCLRFIRVLKIIQKAFKEPHPCQK